MTNSDRIDDLLKSIVEDQTTTYSDKDREIAKSMIADPIYKAAVFAIVTIIGREYPSFGIQMIKTWMPKTLPQSEFYQ